MAPRLFTVLLVCVAAACTRPAQANPASAGGLFVASGGDSAVYQLNAANGRAAGPPIAVGGMPWRLAPAPGGGLVVLAVTEARGCRLTHLTPGATNWISRPLAAPAGLESACLDTLLAGDGHQYLMLGFPDRVSPTGTSASAACRLLAIDLTRAADASVREYRLCGSGDALVGLAVGEGPDGSVAYIGLWRAAAPGQPSGSGAVVALDPETGAILGRAVLAGAPQRLVLAAAPGRTGSRLYAIEGTPGLDERNPGIVSAPPTRWRLLGLDPITLAVVGAVPLDTLGSASATGDDAPPALAVTPDGNDVFVLFRGTGQRSALVAVDGTSGARRPPIFLPGEGLSGLAATDARVYVPDTLERGVWVVRRQTGRLLATVDVGRRPLGITVNPTS